MPITSPQRQTMRKMAATAQGPKKMADFKQQVMNRGQRTPDTMPVRSAPPAAAPVNPGMVPRPTTPPPGVVRMNNAPMKKGGKVMGKKECK